MNQMSPHTELTVGRSPVQVAEIMTQRCANEFACSPCAALLGALDTSPLSVNFARQGVGSEWGGLSAVNAVTRVAGGVEVDCGFNAQFGVSSASAGFDGDQFRYVVVRGRIKSISAGAPEFALFYQNTTDAGWSVDRSMSAANLNVRFRGVVLSQIVAGQDFVAVFDAADSPNYATSWQGQTVDGFRLDIISSTSVYEIKSVQVCALSPLDARGAECYRTRATCKSLANYRALPDGHAVPALTLRDLDAAEIAAFDTSTNAYFVADIWASSVPVGTIVAAGSASNFVYLGVTSASLVFAAGGNTAADQARVSVPASQVAGKSVTLIGEINLDGGGVNLWVFDRVERTLALLGSDFADTAFPAAWAAAIDGQVGSDGGNTYGSEDGGVWSGGIEEVRGHSGVLFDGSAEDEFRLFQYYGRSKYEERPADDVFILPYLRDLSTAPTKVSLAGSNENTDPIGNRASVTLRMTDQPGPDLIDDPYLSDRLFDPLSQPGSYWSRWRVRQRLGRVGARLRIYEGYRGQRLAEMYRREYLLDRLDFISRDAVTLRGRDILSRAELKKTQIPEQSSGTLAVELAATGETTIVLENASVEEYPAPGTVRINKELITYSAVAVNSLDASRVDLTIDARASDRSEASEHSVEDGVQICHRWTNATVSEIATDILADASRIPAQYLDISSWEAETQSYLSAYLFSTVVTEPTAASKLLGGVVESAASFLFWDERDVLVKLRALRSLDVEPPVLGEAEHFLEDSVSIMEKPREQATRVQVFYNPVDFTERLNDPADFLNGYIEANTDLEADDALGRRQIRTILSRWLGTAAQATQTASRLATRYEDVPIEMTFSLDAKDGDLWIGDVFRPSHYQIVDEQGARDEQRIFLITSAEPVVPGEIVKYTAEDATLTGFIYYIAPNSQGDVSFDPSIDQRYGFITDADGLYSDGFTQGSRIT